MGGAIAVRVAAQRVLATLAGVVVVDVVEVRITLCSHEDLNPVTSSVSVSVLLPYSKLTTIVI